MTDHERAQFLATHAPQPALTRRQRGWRLFGRSMATLTFLLAVLGVDRGYHSINCQNNALGERGHSTQQATEAQIDFQRRTTALLSDPNAKDDFVTDLPILKHDSDVLAAVQAQRDAHPLGKC